MMVDTRGNVSMFLTRQQYDYLVTHCQCWVNAHWAEYDLIWSVGGVLVTARAYEIYNLKCQLP